MNELIAKIEQWAEDRNLIKGSTPLDQAMKLFSEFGELADAVAKDDLEGIKDGIGDVFVVLTIICRQIDQKLPITNGFCNDTTAKESAIELAGYLYDVSNKDLISHISLKMAISKLSNIGSKSGFTLMECIEHAYNDIKDRKGIMHNGVFIKESDPRYAELVK